MILLLCRQHKYIGGLQILLHIFEFNHTSYKQVFWRGIYKLLHLFKIRTDILKWNTTNPYKLNLWHTFSHIHKTIEAFTRLDLSIPNNQKSIFWHVDFITSIYFVFGSCRILQGINSIVGNFDLFDLYF